MNHDDPDYLPIQETKEYKTKKTQRTQRIFKLGNLSRNDDQYNRDLLTYGGSRNRLRTNPDITAMNKMKADLEYMPDNGDEEYNRKLSFINTQNQQNRMLQQGLQEYFGQTGRETYEKTYGINKIQQIEDQADEKRLYYEKRQGDLQLQQTAFKQDKKPQISQIGTAKDTRIDLRKDEIVRFKKDRDVRVTENSNFPYQKANRMNIKQKAKDDTNKPAAAKNMFQKAENKREHMQVQFDKTGFNENGTFRLNCANNKGNQQDNDLVHSLVGTFDPNKTQIQAQQQKNQTYIDALQNHDYFNDLDPVKTEIQVKKAEKKMDNLYAQSKELQEYKPEKLAHFKPYKQFNLNIEEATVKLADDQTREDLQEIRLLQRGNQNQQKGKNMVHLDIDNEEETMEKRVISKKNKQDNKKSEYMTENQKEVNKNKTMQKSMSNKAEYMIQQHQLLSQQNIQQLETKGQTKKINGNINGNINGKVIGINQQQDNLIENKKGQTQGVHNKRYNDQILQNNETFLQKGGVIQQRKNDHHNLQEIPFQTQRVFDNKNITGTQEKRKQQSRGIIQTIKEMLFGNEKFNDVLKYRKTYGNDERNIKHTQNDQQYTGFNKQNAQKRQQKNDGNNGEENNGINETFIIKERINVDTLDQKHIQNKQFLETPLYESHEPVISKDNLKFDKYNDKQKMMRPIKTDL